MAEKPKNESQLVLESLLSQLQGLAEDIRRQVDTELARLQQAHEQAAQESCRLEALLSKATEQGNGASIAGQSPPEQSTCKKQASQTAAGAGADADPLAKHKPIYIMADEGLGPLEISQRTGKPLDQVQLILALRKK